MYNFLQQVYQNKKVFLARITDKFCIIAPGHHWVISPFTITRPLSLFSLILDFINWGLLVSRPGDDVFVIIWDVHRQHWGGLVRLEDGGSVWRPPGVEKVVLSCGDKPLATVGELEAQDAALVKIELIFVGLRCVENFDVGILHSYSQPVTSGTVSQAEYLAAEVVLL